MVEEETSVEVKMIGNLDYLSKVGTERPFNPISENERKKEKSGNV